MASGAKSKTPQRFPAEIVATLREGKGLRIRAGTCDHRFISIWVVVVKDRVFVRSWSVKPDGWYSMFLEDPHGAIRVGDRDIPIVATFEFHVVKAAEAHIGSQPRCLWATEQSCDAVGASERIARLGRAAEKPRLILTVLA